MEKINKSHIFLLPKCQGALRVEDFRSISSSNSIYLIIAKVLANHLHEEMGEIIGPFQSAMIPRRLLMDTAVEAGQIIAAWQRKRTKEFMRKVNFAKAYDSLDWEFLWASMKNRGSLEEWMTWVRRCMTTHASSILVNGAPPGAGAGVRE